MRRCDRCQFFYPHPPAKLPDQMVITADEIYGGGQCRRHTPVRDEDNFGLAHFPVVMSDCWCGEFTNVCEDVPQ